MADKSAAFLHLLLVSSSLFLLHEARPVHSSITKENMVTVARKGSGGHGVGHGGGGHGISSAGHGCGDSISSGRGGSYGGRPKSIPFITGGAVFPRTSGAPSHENKHNAALNGYSFSIAALLIITAFWLESLARLYSLSY